MNQKLRPIFIAMVMLFALGILTVPIFAGSNGQKLKIHAGWSSAERIVISGTNQNGHRVTYDSNIHGNMRRVNLGTGDHYNYIDSWWWKGTVQIKVYRNGYPKDCSANVPTSMPRIFGDWFEVGCA